LTHDGPSKQEASSVTVFNTPRMHRRAWKALRRTNDAILMIGT